LEGLRAFGEESEEGASDWRRKMVVVGVNELGDAVKVIGGAFEVGDYVGELG